MRWHCSVTAMHTSKLLYTLFTLLTLHTGCLKSWRISSLLNCTNDRQVHVYQLMPTDCATLPHSQSTIVLYSDLEVWSTGDNRRSMLKALGHVITRCSQHTDRQLSVVCAHMHCEFAAYCCRCGQQCSIIDVSVDRTWLRSACHGVFKVRRWIYKETEACWRVSVCVLVRPVHLPAQHGRSQLREMRRRLLRLRASGHSGRLQAVSMSRQRTMCRAAQRRCRLYRLPTRIHRSAAAHAPSQFTPPEVEIDGRIWTISISGTPTPVTSHNQEY